MSSKVETKTRTYVHADGWTDTKRTKQKEKVTEREGQKERKRNKERERQVDSEIRPEINKER